MSLSGSFNNYPTSSFGLYCDWSATQSIIGNFSDVTLNIYLSYYHLEVGARTDSTASINGASETYSSTAINDYTSGWKKRHLKTKIVRVYHNTDGTMSTGLSASWRFSGTYSGVSIGTITASTTIYLDTIDRNAPTVSLSTSSITSSSVYISASSNVECDIWDYSIDNGASWTNFVTGSRASAATTISGLSPNGTYSIKTRARKTINQIYGSTGTTNITTLGGSLLNSVDILTVDNASPIIYLNWTVYQATYNHTLVIKNGDTPILTIGGLFGLAGTNTKSITLNSSQRATLLSYMATMNSFSANYDLITYNGNSQIGASSRKTGIIETTEANSAPTFSNIAAFTFCDNNPTTVAITGNNQLFIKGYSSLQINAYTVNAKNGANIVRYEASVGSNVVTITPASFVVGSINVSGSSVPVIVKAIDSRGYICSATKNINVIDFLNIKTHNYFIRRVNEVENMTQFSFSGAISPIIISGNNANNIQSARYCFKKTNEDTYGQWTNIVPIPIVSNNSYSFETNIFTSFDAGYSWNIKLEIVDKLSADSVVMVLPQGKPLLSFRQKMLGVNNPNPTCALDVVGTIKQNGISIIDLIYPVGSIIHNVDVNFDQKEHWSVLGVVWELHAKGQVLVGVDTGKTQFNEVNKTGGSISLQKHTHLTGISSNIAGNLLAGGDSARVTFIQNATPTSETGSGDSGNLQPYVTCYIWKRKS